MNNGKKELEHPKSLIEIMSNTEEAVCNYALLKDISYSDAALILVLNELRCIHWHFDAGVVTHIAPIKGD